MRKLVADEYRQLIIVGHGHQPGVYQHQPVGLDDGVDALAVHHHHGPLVVLDRVHPGVGGQQPGYHAGHAHVTRVRGVELIRASRLQNIPRLALRLFHEHLFTEQEQSATARPRVPFRVLPQKCREQGQRAGRRQLDV